MRSPGPAFDLRATLTDEVQAAMEDIGGGEPRARDIHRCRVHLKRARALARVGRAGAPGLASVFNDSARAVMRGLAQKRDLTALADAARRAARKADGKARTALEQVSAALDVACATLAPVDLEATRTGLKDLLALAQVWPETSARQVRRGAERVVGRARRARRRGFKADQPSRRHEWRKREKDRLYAATLLDGDWPKARRRELGKELSSLLGRERDLLLLCERLETAPALAGDERAARRARKALKRRSDRLARRADDLGGRVHAGGA